MAKAMKQPDPAPEPKPRPKWAKDADARMLKRYANRSKDTGYAPTVKVRETGPRSVSIERGYDGRDPLEFQVAMMNAAGTTSVEFMDTYMYWLANAMSAGGIPTSQQYNGALGFLHGMQPRDEIEAGLMGQMFLCLEASMDAVKNLRGSQMMNQTDSFWRLAYQFMRTYAMQKEALKKYRSKGEQRVVVQHVHVNADQAAVQVNGGEGASSKAEDRAHAPTARRTLAHEPGAPMPSPDAAREPLPVAGRSR